MPLELQNQADCFLVLTVKDHDLLGANEFMGEAFSSFQKIASQQCDIQDADQFHLILTKPSNKGKANYSCFHLYFQVVIYSYRHRFRESANFGDSHLGQGGQRVCETRKEENER